MLIKTKYFKQDNLFLAGYLSWISILCLSQLTFSSWDVRQSQQISLLKYQMIGYLIFSLMSLQTLVQSLKNLKRNVTSVDFLLFLLFCIFSIASSIWSIDPRTTILNGVVMLHLFLIFYETKICFRDKSSLIRIVCYVIVVGFLAGLVSFGVNNARTIGGIQPNQLAKIALTIHILFYLTYRDIRAKIISLFISVATCLLLSSRGGVIYVLLFTTLSLTRSEIIFITKHLFKYYFFICVLAFSILFSLNSELIEAKLQLFATHLGIFDGSRGIGSGFSGRTDHWLNGLAAFQDNFLIGTGFKSSKEVVLAHSGILNLLIDVGLIGSSLFFLSIFTMLLHKIIVLNKYSTSENHPDVPLIRISLASIVTFVSIAFIDPIYLNFGFPLTITLFLLMFSKQPIRLSPQETSS